MTAAAQEERAGASNLRVMVEGLAAATCFSENDIAALHRHDKIGALFGHDGRIKPEYRRALSGAEARAKLQAKRNPDGSPRSAPAAPDFYGLAPNEQRALARHRCGHCGHRHNTLSTSCPYATDNKPPRLEIVGTYDTIKIRLEPDEIQCGTYPAGWQL